jgi:hypothetical protein
MEEQNNLEELRSKMAHIKGWAHDADPRNEPNYPYKHYTGDDHKRLDWERPPQQPKTVEILQSVEHLRTPAVFGTANPPSGLSGAIRRQAFKYSENMLRHWLLLLLADRVDAIEGIVSDLRHGKIPNLAKERGFDAMWEHDKKLLAKRIAVRMAIYSAVIGVVAYNILKDKNTRVTLPAGRRKAQA